MKKLSYSIDINKPRELVFAKIMDKSVYPKWAKAWGEGMTFEGEYKVGEHISFFDTSGSGTKVVVEELTPNESIKMKHIAMVESGNKEVTELDETMKKWIGALEEYHFADTKDGGTKLDIIVVADEAFEPMMNAWHKALEYFKEICEQQDFTL